MSHLSPSVFMLWTILTVALAVFYIHHLWHFDRFKCLHFSRKTENGAFKRFMTYSYLIAVPLLFIYTAGFAVIKYDEGYITLPSGAVFPKPFELWTPGHQACYYPLNVISALAWGTETVSHLEELCFWLFLIHSGPSPTSWFKSIYFKIWAGGSVIAMILTPVVTAATKGDPLRNEAWLQFTGSSVALLITIGFLPVLWVFPSFVQNVKNDGADRTVVTRLAKFHDLNARITRIVFRLLFVVPFLVLSIDGLQPHTHDVNESIVWTDFLAMLSSVGCIVQSAITLMIFFPRNVELEAQRWLREPSPKTSRLPKFQKRCKVTIDRTQTGHDRPNYLLTDSPVKSTLQLEHAPPALRHAYDNQSPTYETQIHSASDDGYSMASLDQQKRWNNTNSLGLIEGNYYATSGIASISYPMAHSFTSPIDIDLSDFPRRL